MEHQTPSGFPGNFRKLKVLGTLWFPSGLPETLGKAKVSDKGEPANFFVYYEIDDDESKHNLQLAEHGHQEVPNAWVLLEKA